MIDLVTEWVEFYVPLDSRHITDQFEDGNSSQLFA